MYLGHVKIKTFVSKMGDNLSDKRNEEYSSDIMDDKKQENFEEKYGSTESFSQRAVGSLFGDENSTERPVKERMPKESRPVEMRPPYEYSRSRAGTSHRREPDPDKEYATYIESTERANRLEQERVRAVREEAILERDRKLNEKISEITGRGERRYVETHRPENPPVRDAEEYIRVGRKPNPPINIRNVAAIVLIIFLMIISIFVWQVTSLRGQLNQANAEIYAFGGQLVEMERLRLRYDEMESQIMLQNEEIERLEIALEFSQGTSAGPGHNAGETEGNNEDAGGTEVAGPPDLQTPANLPHTTINAQGQRVYTMQQGDTLWNIAVLIYGDGTRWMDILAANNLTEAQVPALGAGTVLIIPD